MVQTAAAAAFTIVVFGPWNEQGDLPDKVFLLGQAAVTIIWCVAMVAMFGLLFEARRRHRDAFEAERHVPSGLLSTAAVLGIASAIAGIVSTFGSRGTPICSRRPSGSCWCACSPVVPVAVAVAAHLVVRRG